MFIEIHQLKDAGYKKSEVARRLDLNRKTVTKYWDMEPEDFHGALNQAKNRKRKLDKYEHIIVKWLRESPDMTAAQVEDWLKERHHDYSLKERTVRSFVAHVRDKHGIPKQSINDRQYQAVPDPPMGDQMQLDFGEKKVKNESGGSTRIYAFGAVLSHSRHKYGEWSETPFTTDSFISTLINCFAFYGGIPREIVIDQDKLIVVSENFGEIIYTQRFEQFRRKMGFELRVCRGSDPESKGRIEAVVKYIKFGFAANRTFSDISAWNQSCLGWLERTANQKSHGTTKKVPAEVFALEKQYLRPVPSLWSLPTASVTRTVRKDNTIVYKSNRYSVPIGTYAPGKEVEMQVQDGKLIILDTKTKQAIAEHRLSPDKGKLIQNRNHLRDSSASIDELRSKITDVLDYVPGIYRFLDIIRKQRGRYVRDQYNLIFKLQATHSQDIILKAFQFCIDNGLYSAVSLKDALEFFASQPEVAATSEFGTAGLLPDYLLVSTTTRDISEYTRLERGGDSK